MMNNLKTIISSFIIGIAMTSLTYATTVEDCDPISEPTGAIVVLASLATFFAVRKFKKS